MEYQPRYIKDFSKQIAQEERDRLAQEIMESRRAEREVKRDLSEALPRLKTEALELSETTKEALDNLNKLGESFEEISRTWPSRLKNFFKRRALLAEIHGENETYKTASNRSFEVAKELTAKEAVEKRMLIKPKAGEEELATFYGKMRKEWAETPYTKEDLEENFSEENLSSLSLSDYVDLLKRFPTKMVAHVTRQGIRDHIGHSFHLAGQGEYATGFMDIAKDGRLRSPLSVFLARGKMREGLEYYLALDKQESREDALKSLREMTDPADKTGPGTYADRMAIHFATEEVADVYYGSEKGNEVFMIFPSAQIASQYHFAGQLTMSGGGYWNDQFVWANEEKGMNINTGIVFLPALPKVGRETGSLYKLDQKKNPIVNTAFIDQVNRFVEDSRFDEFARAERELSGRLTYQLESIKDIPLDLEPFKERLVTEFGIKDEKLVLALLDYQNLLNFSIIKKAKIEGRATASDDMDEKIESALKSQGIYFELAEDTIPAKEYWEEWFKKNPDAMPSKIVYYEDSDPTTALYKWRKKVGLTKPYEKMAVDDNFLTETEKLVKKDSSQATSGLDRFRPLAVDIVNDYFDKKEAPQKIY